MEIAESAPRGIYFGGGFCKIDTLGPNDLKLGEGDSLDYREEYVVWKFGGVIFINSTLKPRSGIIMIYFSVHTLSTTISFWPEMQGMNLGHSASQGDALPLSPCHFPEVKVSTIIISNGSSEVLHITCYLILSTGIARGEEKSKTKLEQSRYSTTEI